ncbi:MAG: folate family ECF transporter S component [Clostridia bacterium]|nr:folate family ECF transporter S component [Clostridia bacterium]
MQTKPAKVRTAIRRIVMCAAMTAMSVVLCRFLGISPANSAFRIEIGFLPIAVIGMLFGPVWAGAAYGASDLIGAAVTTGINPFITLCKVLFGVMMGFAFKGKSRGLPFTALFFVITGIVVDILCMSPIFVHYFGYTAEAAFATRAISTLVNLPVRIALYYLTERTMGERIRKFAPKGTEK